MNKCKERYCWNCGDSMGLIQDKHYDTRDTCGKPMCEREAGYAADAERFEEHERIDRDQNW